MGMTKEELLRLTEEINVNNNMISNCKYWSSEIYGFGKYFREYGFYPRFLPLHIYSDHGPPLDTDEPFACEINNDSPVLMVFPKAKKEILEQKVNKPVYNIISPFVFYRRKYKIKQAENARGTISFPAHSTPWVEDCLDHEIYIKQLKELPDEFQPVSVCLHMHDIRKGLHEVYMKHGIPVYTAGNSLDYRFTKRFYDILKNFKYSTSNLIGSYTSYSVEMGVPFSLYGQEPEYISVLNDGKKIDLSGNFSEYDKMTSLFKGLYTEITTEQKRIIEHKLGIHEGISRLEMAKILYTAYLKQGNLFEDIKYFITRYLKKPRWLLKQIQAEMFDF